MLVDGADRAVSLGGAERSEFKEIAPTRGLIAQSKIYGAAERYKKWSENHLTLSKARNDWPIIPIVTLLYSAKDAEE